jgi:hypothetical protein
MSLPSFDAQGSLFGSVAVMARELFNDGDRYRLFAERIWPVIARTRDELAQCYCEDNGRPGVEPVLLLGVLIFQFMERVPDRAAVEMVKYHLGWKLALNVELGAKGFHPTTLVGFRQRLIDYDRAKIAFAAVLEALQAEGLVPRKGKQRLDSTHVLASVARLSALECIRETLRLALQELASRLLESERPEFWGILWERYVESRLDYKTSEAVQKDKHRQAGLDTVALLRWLEPVAVEIREGRQVALLRKVFDEQFEDSATGELEPVRVHRAGSVKKPHDPDAQWSAKGRGGDRKEWIGYKVQVAESIPTEPPAGDQPSGNFLTSLSTQAATESDDAGLKAMFQDQRALGLEKPQELYVDAAYVCAEELAAAKAENRELVGPARASAKNHRGFRSEDFDVELEQRRAVCPAGQTSTQCSRLVEAKSGRISYRFEWSTHCKKCTLRRQCIGSGQPHRTLLVGEHHDALQQRRWEQGTEAFGKRMHRRNGIEGTQSELIRGYGLRRTRYRGIKKVDLQNQFIGAACNVRRWLRMLAWEIEKGAAASPASRF